MNLAFIVNNFPTLSETFILNQITGLLEMGHDVEIFAESNLNEKKVHLDVKKYSLMQRVHYFDMPTNKIRRVLKAIYLIITNLHRSPLKMLNSLNIFKYGKYALSLQLFYCAIPFLHKNFDIIHCHFGYNGNIGACLKQIGIIKGKLITMFHGSDIRLGLEERRDFCRQLFKSGDCFLAISDYNYKNLVRFGADPQKIVFHAVGIDLNKFSYRGQSAVLEHPNSLIILTVARLIEEKGLQYGIQAISKLLKWNSELCLEYHIVGTGPLEGELKKIAEELNLGETVRFLGSLRQEEVMREMQQADIFLLPSIAEALPVVLMESQAVGLPVVATSVGSVSQALINGRSGFLVPERNVEALAEQLQYLIEHPEIRLEAGRIGHAFIKEHYDIRNLNKRLLEIYESLVLERSLDDNICQI